MRGRRAALALAAALAGPATAAECRLALLLAVDVSSSVDAEEDALQRGGLAAALTAPEVQRAVFAAPAPVAIAVYEWSGRYDQQVLADWRLIEGPDDLAAVAAAVTGSVRGQTDEPTAMGYALGFAAAMFDRAPPCLHRTLDMAGDGVNNEGYTPAAAYARAAFAEVTVNGLVVTQGDDYEATRLVNFYRAEVLHGPGAFLERAQGFEDYERAMRRKLERELTPRAVGALAAPAWPPPG